MRRHPEELERRRFDLAVVGGGIAGAMAAWDAARRGLSVALVERGDFGAATSAGCYRILHGGLRHLQGLHLRSMRESIRERAFFLRAFPALARPLSCLVPTRRGDGLNGRIPLAAALRLNDWISRDRNRGVPDPALHLPGGHLLSADETRAACPFLPAEGLAGAGVFFDGVMTNTERVVYATAEAAARAGAVVVNHAEASGPPRDGRLVVRDRAGGGLLAVQASAFLLATGPWLNTASPRRYSAGIQLVTDPVETGGHMLSFRTPSGKRLFAMPWRGATVWGTADRDYQGDPGAWSIGEPDIATFLAEIHEALPGLALGRSRVRLAFGGLRPCGSESSAGAAARTAGFGCHDGVHWLEATKFTTARLLAERCLDALVARTGLKAAPCSTRDAVVAAEPPAGNLAEQAVRAVAEESAVTREDVARRLGLGQTGPVTPDEEAVIRSALG